MIMMHHLHITVHHLLFVMHHFVDYHDSFIIVFMCYLSIDMHHFWLRALLVEFCARIIDGDAPFVLIQCARFPIPTPNKSFHSFTTIVSTVPPSHAPYYTNIVAKEKFRIQSMSVRINLNYPMGETKPMMIGFLLRCIDL